MGRERNRTHEPPRGRAVPSARSTESRASGSNDPRIHPRPCDDAAYGPTAAVAVGSCPNRWRSAEPCRHQPPMSRAHSVCGCPRERQTSVRAHARPFGSPRSTRTHPASTKRRRVVSDGPEIRIRTVQVGIWFGSTPLREGRRSHGYRHRCLGRHRPRCRGALADAKGLASGRCGYQAFSARRGCEALPIGGIAGTEQIVSLRVARSTAARRAGFHLSVHPDLLECAWLHLQGGCEYSPAAGAHEGQRISVVRHESSSGMGCETQRSPRVRARVPGPKGFGAGAS